MRRPWIGWTLMALVILLLCGVADGEDLNRIVVGSDPFLNVSTIESTYDYGASVEVTACITCSERVSDDFAVQYPNVEIAATLQTANGNTVDGYIVQSTQGMEATFHFPLIDENMEAGQYKILIETSIDGLQTEVLFYYTAERTTSIDVSSCQIQLTINTSVYEVGEAFIPTAYVTNADGEPVEGVQVGFQVLNPDGSNAYFYGDFSYLYNLTGGDGKCSITSIRNETSTFQAGHYFMHVFIVGGEASDTKLFEFAMRNNSGICGASGSNLTWTLDNRVLTISGSGLMENYALQNFEDTWWSNAPWGSLVDEVHIEDGVSSIGDGAFSNCKLSSIVIPNSVTSIGYGAFLNCSSLPSITIPDSVTSIGNGAFFGCSGLICITIPNFVTSIGDDVFGDCSGLISITIPNGVTSIGAFAFGDCISLSNVTISEGVASIGESAFYNCIGLTSIIIPNSVTSIGAFAFGDCSSLSNVTIPKGVTSIGEFAFYNCISLTSATIQNPNCVIGDAHCNVFYDCAAGFILCGYSGSTAEKYANIQRYSFRAITSEMSAPDFVLPLSTKHIESEAFSDTKVSVVYIPNGVTSLGSKAFANCMNLTQIRIPASITTIPLDVFQGITKTKLTIFGAPGSAAESFATDVGIKFEVE